MIGAAAAAATHLFSRRLIGRRRDRIVTITLALLSPAVAAVAVSVISAPSLDLYDRSLLIAAACVMAISFLSVRFPRAVGFPSIIGIGAIVAFVGYGALALPRAQSETPVGLLVMGDAGTLSVRFEPSGGETREIGGDLFPIRAEALLIRFDRLWPVLGGTERLALTAVRFGEGSPPATANDLVHDPSIDPGFAAGPWISGLPGIRTEILVGVWEEDRLSAGARLEIYRSEGGLRFLP